MAAPGSTPVTVHDGERENPVVPVEPGFSTGVTVAALGACVSNRYETGVALVALPAASVTVTVTEYVPSDNPAKFNDTDEPHVTNDDANVPPGPVATHEVTAPGSTPVTVHDGEREKPVVPVEPGFTTGVTDAALGASVSNRYDTGVALVALPAASVTVTVTAYVPSDNPARFNETAGPHVTNDDANVPPGPVATQEITAPGSTPVTAHDGERENPVVPVEPGFTTGVTDAAAGGAVSSRYDATVEVALPAASVTVTVTV